MLSDVNCIAVPLHVVGCFSLVAFNVFLFLAIILTVMCVGLDLFVFVLFGIY